MRLVSGWKVTNPYGRPGPGYKVRRFLWWYQWMAWNCENAAAPDYFLRTGRARTWSAAALAAERACV